MNKKFLAMVGIAFLSGCAATSPRGVVAMKISDEEAHVCVRKQDVRDGDKVAIYKNVCTRNAGKPALSSCELKRIGSGVVTSQLNDHYSVVRFDKGVEYSEGDVIEVVKQ
ncbi:MAG: hypothetical protein J5J00_02320 [Deltaproteobacteria bacterium]|nr:hypothetical protein [Deltaproteobacteria bacterium]